MTQKWLFDPEKWLKSDFSGSKWHFLVTFESLYTKRKKSLFSLFWVKIIIFSLWVCSWAGWGFHDSTALVATMGPKFLKTCFELPETSFAIPLACYRIGFGRPARNRKKIGKYRFRPSEALPPENRGKKSWKIGKWSQIPIFRIFFSYFLAFFPIFRARAREAKILKTCFELPETSFEAKVVTTGDTEIKVKWIPRK